MGDLKQDALDLVDLVSEQVRNLGAHSQVRKAITLFGHIGRQPHGTQFTGGMPMINADLRRPLKQSGLLPILLETSVSLLESAVSSLMMWLWGFLKWTWKTVRANRVILFLLVSSFLINIFHSYHDALWWVQERNASKFMNRLGVRPNGVMSKAIYLKDMDDAIANATNIEFQNSSSW